jgi:PAS domain S-box-containing protein
MPLQWSPLLLLFIVTAAIPAVTALYAWQRRNVPGAQAGLILLCASCFWLICTTFEIASSTLQTKLFWSTLQYLGATIIPTGWLIYSLQYSGNDGWLTRPRLLLLAIVPITMMILALTNGWHGLVWREVWYTPGDLVAGKRLGIAFYLFTLHAYVMVIAGLIPIVRIVRRNYQLHRGQSAALLLAVVAIWVGDLITGFLGWSPLPGLEVTPLILGWLLPIMGWSLARLQHWDILPVARSTVLDQLADHVIMLDAQGRIVDLNPSAQALSGQSTRSALGRTMQHLWPDWPVDFLSTSQQQPTQREIALLIGGQPRVYDVRFSPLTDWRDVVVAHALVLRDSTERKAAMTALERSMAENARLYAQAQQEISERKAAEAALQAERALLAQRVAERTAELAATNEQLLHMAQSKDEFFASVSHELRTPLHSLLLTGEALENRTYGALTPPQRQALQRIMTGGRHLLALINDLLDVSKIEAGKFELELAPVDVHTLCQESLQFVHESAQRKGLHLTLELAAAQQLSLLADGRRLQQVLINLLSNAVKFTPPGGQIGLTVCSDVAAGVLRFIVWDTGIGIAVEDQPRLFHPFVQVNRSAAHAIEGTGLGLALAQRLVELHQGAITVESTLGSGSHFTVTLPWRAPPEPLPTVDLADSPARDLGTPQPLPSSAPVDVTVDMTVDMTVDVTAYPKLNREEQPV